MNTNMKPRTEQEGATMMAQLRTGIVDVLGTRRKVLPFIKFRDNPGDRRDLLIGSMQSDIGVELGTKNGRLHAHIYLRITHWVGGLGIHLYKDAMQQALDQHMRTVYALQIPYLHIIGVTPSDVWEQYIHKDNEKSAFTRVKPRPAADED